MKTVLLSITLSLSTLFVSAQWNWYDPLKAEHPVIQNQGWSNEIGKTYTRLPETAKNKVPKAVWELSQHSAGLSIYFYSNAPDIKVRYAVNGTFGMDFMPATSVSGIDLYRIDSDGKWSFCSGDFSFGDTITYQFNRIKKDKYHDLGYEYHLYLPLYNSIKWMEIGVPDKASMEFIPVSNEKPIVLYGTSIVQGACASRPGMAWSSIIERSLDCPLINLGFSGNGKMEKEVIQYINEIEAKLFIFDCLPNLTDLEGKDIAKRIVDAVKAIRKKHSAPILLIEYPEFSNANTDSLRTNQIINVNDASLYAYRLLQSECIRDIHYLFSDDFQIPTDGWVDHVHYNDLGMQAQALIVENKIREILKMPKGNLQTTIPVKQRREPHNYEWLKRHNEILALNNENPLNCVILGNSITHFWGGEPIGPFSSGTESWDTFMKPEGFRNQGCGWDRIENVLWRVYHGELDGFNAKKIVLMIGTNNIGINSDNEIIEGLNFLLKSIHDRQPNATIKVVGILPRRDQEQYISNINKRIEEMALKEGYLFQNAGNVLLDVNGKIDESLFSDGLHPNEKGYNLIGMFIADFE